MDTAKVKALMRFLSTLSASTKDLELSQYLLSPTSDGGPLTKCQRLSLWICLTCVLFKNGLHRMKIPKSRQNGSRAPQRSLYKKAHIAALH